MKKDVQLANEIKKLQYQLSYSEHINKELSEQLAFMSEKAGLPSKRMKTTENINMINTQNQLQELYYVEPLLMAYQHKNQLLEQQIKQLKEDSDSLIEFGDEIVSENVFLRKELESKNLYIMKSDQIGLNVNFLKLDNQNLIEKNKILQEKYTFLMEKLKQFEDASEKNRVNLSIPNANLNQAKKQLRAERQKSKNYEIKIMQFQKNLEIVSNQLNNQKSLLKEQERKTFQFENEVIKLKNELKICKQQYQSYQIVHDGITNNHDLEIQTLKTQLLAAQRRQNELFTKNMNLQTEIQDKNAKCHNLSLQNTRLQTQNNNILQIIETYEVKVRTQQKKISQLESQLKDHIESTNYQRKQCQMLEWKLSQKEKQMEKKESEWKKERDRITKMWEERFQATKKVFDEEKSQLFYENQNLKQEVIKPIRR